MNTKETQISYEQESKVKAEQYTRTLIDALKFSKGDPNELISLIRSMISAYGLGHMLAELNLAIEEYKLKTFFQPLPMDAGGPYANYTREQLLTLAELKSLIFEAEKSEKVFQDLDAVVTKLGHDLLDFKKQREEHFQNPTVETDEKLISLLSISIDRFGYIGIVLDKQAIHLNKLTEARGKAAGLPDGITKKELERDLQKHEANVAKALTERKAEFVKHKDNIFNEIELIVLEKRALNDLARKDEILKAGLNLDEKERIEFYLHKKSSMKDITKSNELQNMIAELVESRVQQIEVKLNTTKSSYNNLKPRNNESFVEKVAYEHGTIKETIDEIIEKGKDENHQEQVLNNPNVSRERT